jgi:hypothetical protein
VERGIWTCLATILGATTNDLFAKAMVIGPACPWQGRRRCCYRTGIAHRRSRTSMIFSTPILRTLEFGMSAFTAALLPANPIAFPAASR